MFAPCPAPFNLARYVLAKAALQPDKVALAILGPTRAERWSYARLEEAVLRTGGALLAAGMVPGDRLMLRLGNTPDFPVAFLGAIAVGIVPIPTSAALTLPEITRLAALLGPKAILAAPGIALPHPLPCPVLSDLSGPAAVYQESDPDRLAYIVLTSGSSGSPKPVAHAHRAVWARRMMWEGWYGLTPEDRVLHAGAFNWTYTLGTGLLDPWAIGATALIPAEGVEIAALPLLLKRHDATILAGAPGIFRRILTSPMPGLPALRHGLSAGEKLPESLRQRWEMATGTQIHEALGMSECSTFLSGSPLRPAPEGTLGYAQKGRRIAVLDETGQPVPPGSVGILAIHQSDPGLMLGYLEPEPELPLTGAWFLTGDLVGEEPDGAYTYHGRRDDLLTAGGYRIAPSEIEAAFDGVPDLVECAALTLRPTPETTILALAYSGRATEIDLQAHAQTCLARWKQPRAYLPLSALPRSANGKLDRRALADKFKARFKEQP